MYKANFKSLYRLKSIRIILSHRGFGFTEVLIVTGIISVILVATTKVATRAMSVSRAVQAVSSENELQLAVAHILADDEYCKDNLKPITGKLEGSDATMGIGTIDQLAQNSSALVEVNKDINTNITFRNNLQIVKMSLESPISTPQDPHSIEVERHFKVFYKMRGIGNHLNTKNGGSCFNDGTTIDTTGCYSNQCILKYRLDTFNNVTTCKLLSCTDRLLSAEPFVDLSCFTAEKADRKRLLFGCGTTQALGGIETMAIGNDIDNITISGRGNSFIGHEVAYNATVSGNRNTFAGYQAGMQTNINNNSFASTFLGYQAGRSTILQGGTEGNTFLGSQAGRSANITGGRGHTFVGYQSGYNATLTGAEGSTFLGYQAGEDATVTGIGNTFLGAQSGQDSTISGNYNTFLGFGAGYNRNISDSRLINIGNFIVAKQASTPNTISSTPPTPDSTVGYVSITGGLKDCPPNRLPENLSEPPSGALYTNKPHDLKKRRTACVGLSPREHDEKHETLNIGLRFLASGNHYGRLEICNQNGIDCDNVSLETHIHNELHLSSPFQIANTGGGNIREVSLKNHTHTHFAEAGHQHDNLLYGDDVRHAHPFAHINHRNLKNITTTIITSSRSLKKNITPFNSFDTALEDIVNTPLFTYKYKKNNHPHKKRMGIISEELPEHLQIKKTGKVSQPDWPSIYGTFWASLKALSIKFSKFKEHILSELKNIEQESAQLKSELALFPNHLSELELNMNNSHKELSEWEELIMKNEDQK